MSSVTPARAACLRILRSVGRGRRLDLAFAAETRGLPRTDRAWIHRCVYGVIRLRGRMDHVLDSVLHRSIDSLDPDVLDLLRLGAYQLLHMDSVPDYAAVSESVAALEGLRHRRAASLVNAVLRSVAAEGAKEEAFPAFGDDPAGWLSSWGSHPRWLIDRWLTRWSPDEVRALVEANNRIPELCLTLVDGPDAVGPALATLEEAGMEARRLPEAGSSVALSAGTDPATALSVCTRAMVQDPAAAQVVPFIGPVHGVVADLCAAPGGKTAALAAQDCFVVAADRSWPRVGLLRENVSRVGGRVGIVQALAEQPPLRDVGVVLVDAPCSGTGTLRRHPDARWRLSPADVASLARVQERILDSAAQMVSSGGQLVYSTCTLEPEENEEQVERFLSRHRDFELEPSTTVDDSFLDGAGRLCVLPQRSGFDGAFAAKLRRR